MRIRAIQSACTQAGWRSGRISRTASVFITVLFFSGGAVSAEDPVVKAYEIAAQSVSTALKVFAAQSDMQLIFTESDVGDVRTAGINGNMTPREALTAILKGTDLEFEFTENNVIVVRKPEGGTEALANSYFVSPGEGRPDPGNGRTMSAEGRMAQASTANSKTTEEESKGGEEQRSDSRERDRRLMEEIIVTGTNIRGIAPESSPTRTFTREDIQTSGAATAQDFLQLLPQNFGGGANADIPTSLPNDTTAGVNRTSAASVNLRGLGAGSTLVLLNGHRLTPSSELGSFVDVSMIPATAIERVEILTDGASSLYGGDAVAGVTNFVLRDNYEGVETSLRYGTVTEGETDEYRASLTSGASWNAGNALLVYEYFDQDNLSASDRAFSEGAALPTDLLPTEQRHSVLSSLSHSASSKLKLGGDLLYSRRQTNRNVRRTADASAFTRDSVTENWNASANLSWQAFADWFVDLSGAYSRIDNTVDTTNDALGGDVDTLSFDSELWSVDLKSSGTVFRLPGGPVKLAIGGHYRQEDFLRLDVDNNEIEIESDREVYAFFGEAFMPLVGEGNAFPGVKRFELNVSGRISDFSDFGVTANPKVGVLWSPADGLRLRGSYSTSFNPPPLGRVGVPDRIANAVPQSFYNSVLGLEAGDPSIADVVALTVFGTDKDLDAERSRAFTAGLDYEFSWERHHVLLSSSYFDIEFEGRVGSTPIPGNRSPFDAPNIAFNSPELLPEGSVIFDPSPTQIQEILDSLDVPVRSFFGAHPFDAKIINLTTVTKNLSRSEVRGFDFDVSYSYETKSGQIRLGLDGTFLTDFQQQAAVTTPLVEQVDTLFNPVDLKLRCRGGYTHDGLSANVFVNYIDNYRVDSTDSAMPIDAWTTVDVSVSFDSREKFRNLLDNTRLRFSVLNLFDEDPPSTPGSPRLGIFGFDPTNASPLGRFVAVELTKAL